MYKSIIKSGNTKGGKHHCTTDLLFDWSVLQLKTKIVSCHTADSKPVKQEVNGTVLLPPFSIPCLNDPFRFSPPNSAADERRRARFEPSTSRKVVECFTTVLLPLFPPFSIIFNNKVKILLCVADLFVQCST